MFAVWQPMLPTDISAPVAGTLARLLDRRVRQYYDPDHLIARRLKADARAPQPEPACCMRHDILWDLLVVYPPGAEWTDRLPVATTVNGPVVDVMGHLEEALKSPRGSR